jgi:hypothetical protein
LTILPLFELHFGSIGHSGGAPWSTLDSQSAVLGRPWGHLGPQDPPRPPEDPPKSAQGPSKSLFGMVFGVILMFFKEHFERKVPRIGGTAVRP